MHYQGIIHRDIKPANLLWTEDRSTVKIVDFGVSHYHPKLDRRKGNAKDPSEDDSSLFPETDLLKRTGTPSFLAPEVVWFPEQDVDPSPATSSDTLASNPNRLTNRLSTTIGSKTTAMPAQRPPITTAIDLWSLGVTFYCFLFGHTPFIVPESIQENVHHNEYMLYHQICTQDWPVEDTMGADRVVTGGRNPSSHDEGSVIISLLDQMLQKDPKNRIALTELKVHLIPLNLCNTAH